MPCTTNFSARILCFFTFDVVSFGEVSSIYLKWLAARHAITPCVIAPVTKFIQRDIGCPFRPDDRWSSVPPSSGDRPLACGEFVSFKVLSSHVRIDASVRHNASA
jgi:hypothetical protein